MSGAIISKDQVRQMTAAVRIRDLTQRRRERTGILDIDVADTLVDGWQFWRGWQRMVSPDNAVEIQALEADRGPYLGYVRLVGRRRLDAPLDEPLVSIASTKAPLLRTSE